MLKPYLVLLRSQNKQKYNIRIRKDSIKIAS